MALLPIRCHGVGYVLWHVRLITIVAGWVLSAEAALAFAWSVGEIRRGRGVRITLKTGLGAEDGYSGGIHACQVVGLLEVVAGLKSEGGSECQGS